MLKKLVAGYAKKENEMIARSIEQKKHLLPKEITILRKKSFDRSEGGSGTYNVYYDPETLQEKKNLPMILNIHGGGMVCGMIEQNDLLCAKMAQQGYIVFAIEYPLLPAADVFAMYRCIVAGLNAIAQEVDHYGVDTDKVYWTADSAGGYLITNLAMLCKNEEMRREFQVPSVCLEPKALGLISGMFYTNKKDKIGMVLPGMMFGKNFKKKSFYRYTDLEKEEQISLLPPCYFVTSMDDMLKSHTLCFEKALRENGQRTMLRVFEKDKRLEHAFVALFPEYEESEIAYKEMLQFFAEI